MPRKYTISFRAVSVSAVQDLVSLKGSSGKICKLRRATVQMSAVTLPTAQGMNLNVKYGSATVTLGSGGSTPTPKPLDPGDSAASFSCHANDTSQATTSGAFSDITPNGGHVFSGFDYNWGNDGPIFGLNTGIVFEMATAPSGTIVFSGSVEVEEIG